ncbi:MAG TPA: fasciclin domain-containing protein [Anaerolineales bacterium]|nr:fasciclin domain-containing protein [Anaerolineales bacterium]
MKIKSLSLIVGFALLVAACAPAATPTPEPTQVPEPVVEETPKTIVDIAVEDGRFNTLVAALQAAELVETLQGNGPFTVFAPTDDAFLALGDTLNTLLLPENKQQLTDILLYHVVPGAVLAADVVALDGQLVDTALAEKQLAVSVDMGNVYLNENVQVIITDIVASNGIIHVVDAVLLPPAELGTIVDIAVADGRFNTLVAALQAADLVETLQGEGPFTVFAPTDEAFAALGDTLNTLLLPENKQQLTDILLYHVVPGAVLAADVVALDGQMVDTALAEKQLAVSVDMGNVYLNENVQVIITDIEASNGVIHVIDAVLLPPAELGTIVDIAVADGRFNTLVAALQAAELVETLQGDGPFTVFAPTDEAFAALGDTVATLLLPENKQQLTDILLYHVVPGAVLTADVVALDGQMVDTALAGNQIAIRVDMGNVYLNENVMVIITDIQASNGVIHVIDAVLLP